MQAILTTDGSIKIILLPTCESAKKSKDDVFFSKEIVASKASTESKLNETPINLNENILHDDEDDEQFSKYMLGPRQIFAATTCQVSC
jgi:hypothetical protein